MRPYLICADGSASRPYLISVLVGAPRRGDRTHGAMRPYLNLAARPCLICADGWASRPYLVCGRLGEPSLPDKGKKRAAPKSGSCEREKQKQPSLLGRFAAEQQETETAQRAQRQRRGFRNRHHAERGEIITNEGMWKH